MKRRFLCAGMTGIFCFLLSGCGLFAGDIAQLLKPPALSGNISLIADAVRQSAGDDYTLKYPSRGNYRSAVVENDIDGDGISEAFAFYAKTVEEETTMYLDMIAASGNQWQSVSCQNIVAGGVDKVDFCDLDGDGIKEILVGWEIYGTSEMQLAVYRFHDHALEQRMLQQYSQFVCCDLNENKKNEILLVRLNTAEQTNNAYLYELKETGVEELYSCELDRTVKTVNDPMVSSLSSGKAAVYLDEIKGVGAVTEVIFIEKNRLVNPLLNPESGETSATLRSAVFGTQDINGDGILEIPVQQEIPSVLQTQTNEKLYLTDWCSYNGEALTSQLTAMMNTVDGYYYMIPAKWTERIAVLKDTSKHVRELYRYNAETGKVGELLLSFKTVKNDAYDRDKYRETGYSLLTRDDISAFLVKKGSSDSEDLQMDNVRKAFQVIEQGGKTE